MEERLKHKNLIYRNFRNGLNQRRGIGPPEEVRSHRIQTKTEAERTKPLVFIGKGSSILVNLNKIFNS